MGREGDDIQQLFWTATVCMREFYLYILLFAGEYLEKVSPRVCAYLVHVMQSVPK